MNAAIALVALLFVGSAASVVAGIYLLAGVAWALIASGIALFGAAFVLRSRLTTDG